MQSNSFSYYEQSIYIYRKISLNNIAVDIQFLLNCYRIHFLIPKTIVNAVEYNLKILYIEIRRIATEIDRIIC